MSINGHCKILNCRWCGKSLNKLPRGNKKVQYNKKYCSRACNNKKWYETEKKLGIKRAKIFNKYINGLQHIVTVTRNGDVSDGIYLHT